MRQKSDLACKLPALTNKFAYVKKCIRTEIIENACLLSPLDKSRFVIRCHFFAKAAGMGSKCKLRIVLSIKSANCDG